MLQWQKSKKEHVIARPKAVAISSDFRNTSEIATPVCALARNDVILFDSKLPLGVPMDGQGPA